MKKLKTRKRLTPKQIDRIWHWDIKGKSERWIAKKVGCSRSAVWYHLNK
jgi:DNA-binding CsgD family transcriptional regulator